MEFNFAKIGKTPFDNKTAKPIRVIFKTDLLKTQTRNEDEYNFLVNQVIPTAKLFYESRLHVNRRPIPWSEFRGQKCAEVDVPNLPDDLEADIILFATAKNEPQ